MNAIEGTPLAVVHGIFEANLFGMIATMQAVLPGMRERGARVVVPGMAPSTSFAANAQEQIANRGWFPDAYQDFARQTMAAMQAAGSEDVTTARDVAEAIFRAATDADCPMVLPAGADAIAWATGG